MRAEHRERYEQGMRIAKIAGQAAKSYFDRGVLVETKSDRSPVTVADRHAEEIIRREVQRLFPNDGFEGEEYGDQTGSSGYRWIIDPIDGTRSFVRNIPIWATLLALQYQGEVVAGITYMPMTDECWHTLQGDGAYRDGSRIHVSQTTKMSEAMLAYPGLNWIKLGSKKDEFLKLVDAVDRAKGYGDFYGFVLVAQGSCDIMVDHGVHIWDVAGLKILVEEAGGKFTDWKGEPRIDRPDVIASNGHLHAETLGYFA